MTDINPLSQGPFTDTSDANMSLINDISDVVNNKVPTLPNHLIQSAKQAGELAKNASTLEDKQNIYKNYLSKSNNGNQETTRSMVHDWENAAEYYRKNQ